MTVPEVDVVGLEHPLACECREERVVEICDRDLFLLGKKHLLALGS